MERSHTDDSAEADRALNDVFDNADSVAPDDDTDARFLGRVEDYCHESLDRPDAREACIGAINAGVMKMLHRTEKQIDHAMESSSASLLESPQVKGAMTVYLALAREVDRLTDLEERIAEARERKQNVRSGRRQDPLLARASQPRRH